MTGLSAPGWPRLSSTHFHVAVKGKPMYIVVRPHTAGCHNLLETPKDAGPHAKELGSRPALPFLVTEPIPFMRLYLYVLLIILPEIRSFIHSLTH